MTINYRDLYRRRVLRNKDTRKELELLKAKEAFRKYLDTSITACETYVTDIDEPCITEKTKKVLVAITDVTNNDATALDEKNLYTLPDENVGVGCYVRFDDVDWLVTFQEHQRVGAKKHFIMRRCNNYMTVAYKGEDYKIPLSVENLTMYSDGVNDMIYLSYMDSKKQIWYGSNPITRSITENFRVLLTHDTAFRITHINDFEYVGLIKSLVLQTANVVGDDYSTNKADNTTYFERKQDSDKETYPFVEKDKIIGNKKFRIGEEREFTFHDSVPGRTIRWELEDKGVFRVKSMSESNIVIASNKNLKDIGKKTTLKVLNNETGEMIDSISIYTGR